MKHIVIASIVLGLVLTSAAAFAASPYSAGKWSDETLDLFATLPIQDGGRVKPLYTYASVLMLRLNAKRSLELEETKSRKDYLTHMEWFLDCLFFPDVAVTYPHFSVDNADAITTLGIERHEKQRDRYSYQEIEPRINELFAQAEKIRPIEPAERTITENQIYDLAQKVYEFQQVIHFLDFAREPFPETESGLIKLIFGDDTGDLTVSGVMAKNPEIQFAFEEIRQAQAAGKITSEAVDREMDAVQGFFFPLDFARQTSFGLRLLPPTGADKATWWTPAEMVDHNFQVEALNPDDLVLLGSMEKLARYSGNALAFRGALDEFRSAAIARAKARGEYGKIPMEVSLYRAKPFFYAQVLFVLSFVVAGLLWLSLRNKWLYSATAVAVTVPWAFLVYGIVMRCIIRGRPPVSTLYETILFITAVAVLVAVFVEYINRQRIALSAAAFLGTLGMFLANRYEITNKSDTMPKLEAVLDTNFWLATHVTIINVGYAAGMLAAGIAHFYIIGKLLGIAKENKAVYRNITRMVYGVTCFGLLFAFVGTVLGGIWANYSWGRFWGWDPKENGAALICLCQMAMLHARMGGYIREIGMHVAAIFTGCVVAFSWWGVNLLGVGLHSYGFTSGIWTATYIFWSTQGVMMALGIVVFIRGRLAKSRAKDDATGTGEVIAAK